MSNRAPAVGAGRPVAIGQKALFVAVLAAWIVPLFCIVLEPTQAAESRKATFSQIALGDCEPLLETPDARCGEYEVFENRSEKIGRKIKLKIAVLPALGPERAPDPLFILAGGPGQGAIGNIGFWAKIFAPIRRERDLVMVDQRGAGGSNGLHCDLYGSDLQDYFRDRFSAEGVLSCRQSLEGKGDLRFYTTQLATEDLEDIRRELGYDKINLFGTSYGTRAAQVYVRNYPFNARSMILKGVMRFDLSQSDDVDRSVELLFKDCLADAACKTLYPGIEEEYRTLLARLKRDKVRIKHPDTGEPTLIKFPPIVLTSSLRSLLQNINGANQALALIHKAATGNIDPLAQMVATLRRGFVKEVSVGMMLSVLCSEDAVFSKGPAAIGPDQLVDACRLWPKGRLPAGFATPLKSDVPALLISGSLDPATPPAWADEVAQGLSRSRRILIRNASHSYTGLSPCVDQIMASFIAQGSAEKLDTNCVGEIQRPEFKDANVQQD